MEINIFNTANERIRSTAPQEFVEVSNWIWKTTVSSINLVSACLCGIPCRYDGKSKPVDRFVRMFRSGKCVPFCPERLGGLTTPREPAVLSGGDGFAVLDGTGSVILRDADGDVTDAFLKGAELSVIYASVLNPDIIYLKEKSPSCGISCGTDMPGVAAAALMRSGFTVEAVD